ncbi:chromatin structure-remodeling complex subunit RSC7, partial [Coemansia sp. RSA 2603]
MRRSSKAAATKSEWTGESTSPLSSLSTPAGSEIPKSKQSKKQQAVRRSSRRITQTSAEREHEEEEEEAQADSGSEAGESDGVDELLTGAARAIRAQVSSGRLEAGEQSDETEGRRRSALKRKGSAGGSGNGSGNKRKAGRRSLAATAASDNEDNEADNIDEDAKEDESGTPSKWRPGKRGRPPKHVQAQRVAEQSQADESAADEGAGTAGASDADSEAEADSETDPAGELKIDRNGRLLGGREFICPVVQSPFRRNTRRQYILTMDCCRFTGARDSYMLFKQHPRMRHVETTQEERDMLAEQRLIPKVTRFRTIRMVTARTAFREFGARLVRDGRYITDDYWEAAARREARYPEGTLVANMSVYRELQAAQAAGMTPGSTRKARRANTPLRSPVAGDALHAPDMPVLPINTVVGGWAALETQHRA